MLMTVTADIESSSTEFQELIYPNFTGVEIAVERCLASLLRTPQYGAEMDFEAKTALHFSLEIFFCLVWACYCS